MVELPVLNLTCLKEPSGRCVLVAESCPNCRNRNIISAHAAAYNNDYLWICKVKDQRGGDIDSIVSAIGDNLSAEYKRGARDAVLKLAGLRVEDLEATE